MAAKASKNNPGNRTSDQRKRMYQGKVVKATKYFGRPVGHGIYMAGLVDGKLVMDATGRPLPLREVGSLE